MNYNNKFLIQMIIRKYINNLTNKKRIKNNII